VITEAEARRVRPFMSGMIALVVALAAAIGWYYLGRPDESQQPVQTVEWKPWLKAGRADGKLLMLAPAELPSGWRATSASYRSGVAPAWHVGMLTGSGKYVGLEESAAIPAELVEQYVDKNATRGKDVRIGDRTWQVWTDAGGDYALLQDLRGTARDSERVLVVGSADDAQIRDFAGSLSTGGS